MQVVVLLLLVASLALLVSGLITGSTPLVVVSIVASVLAVYTISRYRNRQPAAVPPAGSSKAGSSTAGSSSAGLSRPDAQRAGAAGRPSADRAAASTSPSSTGRGAASGESVSPAAAGESEPVLAADLIARQARAQATSDAAGAPAADGRAVRHHGSGGRAAAAPSGPVAAGDAEPAADGKAAVGGAAGDGEPATGGTAGDDAAVDEPPVAETDPPLRSRGDEPVWVIDGRPRYHLDSCGFLQGREPESVPLRQAVEDGFTPCALCDPDSGLVAAAANRD